MVSVWNPRPSPPEGGPTESELRAARVAAKSSLEGCLIRAHLLPAYLIFPVPRPGQHEHDLFACKWPFGRPGPLLPLAALVGRIMLRLRPRPLVLSFLRQCVSNLPVRRAARLRALPGDSRSMRVGTLASAWYGLHLFTVHRGVPDAFEEDPVRRQPRPDWAAAALGLGALAREHGVEPDQGYSSLVEAAAWRRHYGDELARTAEDVGDGACRADSPRIRDAMRDLLGRSRARDARVPAHRPGPPVELVVLPTKSQELFDRLCSWPHAHPGRKPTHAELADFADMSERTMRRHLAILKDRGLVRTAEDGSLVLTATPRDGVAAEWPPDGRTVADAAPARRETRAHDQPHLHEGGRPASGRPPG